MSKVQSGMVFTTKNKGVKMDKDELLKAVLQSAIIEQIVEKRIEDKLSGSRMKENIKRMVMDALDDYSVKEKIKKIAQGR